MPNKDNIRKLVVALRSGEYQQGRDSLCMQEKGQSSYCCMGVACRLAIKDGVKIEVDDDSTYVKFDNTYSDAPQSIMDWLGIDRPQRNILQHMNDGSSAALDYEKYSFLEIADYLEKTYLHG